MMNARKDISIRIATLALGLFVMAMGIALCIRACLGITPISCPPYVLSLALPFTVGEFTILMHVLLIIGQYILLRREFRADRWLQIPLAVAFGTFIDSSMWITKAIAPSCYITSILILLIGNALLALGMYFEIKSNLVLVPTDGFVQAVSQRTNLTFAHLKIAFDVSLLLISVVCSLLLLGHIKGIREGTFISAILVGYFLGIIRRIAK